MQKQVDKSHYDFGKYVKKRRWLSMWHQVQEVLALQPKNVLEIGPGPGIFKTLIKHFAIDIQTLDIAEDLQPDYVCSADKMPFVDNHYDLVCAFQMLEHVPLEQSLRIFKEMARVARRNVVISLPNAKAKYAFEFYVPKKGAVRILLNRPFWQPRVHKFDGEHYWEINKQGYLLEDVIAKFEDSANGVKLVKQFRVKENPYHHFFIFAKC